MRKSASADCLFSFGFWGYFVFVLVGWFGFSFFFLIIFSLLFLVFFVVFGFFWSQRKCYEHTGFGLVIVLMGESNEDEVGGSGNANRR